MSYDRTMAEAYAEATNYRAQAIEAQREAASAKAEQERERMATIPHWYRAFEMIPGFCGRCGRREDNPIHTRKEDK